MRSIAGIVTASVLGVALAAGTALGIASVVKQTPGNTKSVDPQSHAQILYGGR